MAPSLPSRVSTPHLRCSVAPDPAPAGGFRHSHVYPGLCRATAQPAAAHYLRLHSGTKSGYPPVDPAMHAHFGAHLPVDVHLALLNWPAQARHPRLAGGHTTGAWPLGPLRLSVLPPVLGPWPWETQHHPPRRAYSLAPGSTPCLCHFQSPGREVRRCRVDGIWVDFTLPISVAP